MAKITFSEYLTCLHEMGEFGLALSEAKRFMDAYIRQNAGDAAAKEQADQLSLLLARWSGLDNEVDMGTVERSQIVLERNQINVTLKKWLTAFENSPAAAYPFEDYGRLLPPELREKIWGQAEERQTDTPDKKPQGNSLLLRFGIGALVLLLLGYGLYRAFSNGDSAKQTSKCTIQVYYTTRLYSEPDLASATIMVFRENRSLTPLELRTVNSFSHLIHFFKVKVDGVDGWINYDETEKNPSCFEWIKNDNSSSPQPQERADPQHTNTIPDTPAGAPAGTESSNNTHRPAESAPAEAGCYLTGGMLTTLFSQPNMFSEQIGRLLRGKKYKILDKAIYNHGNLSKHTFYKVKGENENVGWVMQDADLNVSAQCR